MRELKDHVVEGDSSNHQLKVEVTDEPGAGGANHRYDITGFDTETNPSATPPDGFKSSFGRLPVLFQNGPIKEAGVNGITHEVLLAIVMDRLRSFQAGDYKCEENQAALEHCTAALYMLQGRTRKRLARGVEGTHQK
jgi:hypothetical protein